MKLPKWFNSIVTIIGKIQWNKLVTFVKGQYYDVTDEEQQIIREKLTNNYYIILTRRKTHLSGYAISLSHLLLTGRWGHYGHALMNCENKVTTDDDFILVEATNKYGVAQGSFGSVFDCDSVCLLTPKHITADEWTAVLENLLSHQGKPYDTLYDLIDEREVSCVELVRLALQAVPDYNTKFAAFEQMIATSKNLTPHMFYECPDFIVDYEVRH